MSNEQLYLVIGVPMIFNALLFLGVNWRMGDLKDALNARIDGLEKVMIARFDTAHEQLIRVEQVMDARLKHFEDKS